MLSVTSEFIARAAAGVQRLSYAVQVSFAKTFDDAIDFFSIGESTIGGDDIIRGEGDVIQEWDKYDYLDYSDRVIGLEWSREEEPISSVSSAIADVVLDNHDDYFTPDGDSPIAADILPYRPFKLFAGFSDENVPALVGLSEGMPEIDEDVKQARFHVVDFWSSLMNRPLDEAVLMENLRTDEALAELLQLAGLSATQYDLDTGFNVMRFVFFPSGIKLGKAVEQLMTAEMGRFYMDELGVLRFKNRQNYSQSPVATYDDSNIIEIKTRKKDEIVNVVELNIKVREVQSNNDIYRHRKIEVVPAGATKDIWAEFQDPATGVDDPVYYSGASTSFFVANQLEDGSGTAVTNLVLDSSELFGQAFLMTFSNPNSFDVYITTLGLYGTAAVVTRESYIRVSDDASVAKYEERPLPAGPIDSEFFPNEVTARSKALIMLEDLAEYGAVKELWVKYNPALQIGDAIDITKPGYEGTYAIRGIANRLTRPADASQILKVKRVVPREYWTIGVSSIGGDDEIAP